jgi:hypothetical protein
MPGKKVFLPGTGVPETSWNPPVFWREIEKIL